MEELRLLGAGGAEAFPDGTEVLGGLDSKDDAGDQEEGAPPQAEPEGVPGVSHHVTQDHTAAVQGSGEGLAGGNALSHLWYQHEAATCQHSQTHGCSERGDRDAGRAQAGKHRAVRTP